MTAEIAILNLEAVALAADSAVTVQGSDGTQKIFLSGNKLLALSDEAPVGMLTYGSGRFMAITWEVLVKEYKRKSKNKVFSTLSEYTIDFCRFLSSKTITNIINEEYQDDNAIELALLLFQEIGEEIEKRRTKKFKNEKESTFELFKNLYKESLEEITEFYYKRAQKAGAIEGIGKDLEKTTNRMLRDRLREERKQHFRGDLPKNICKKLDYIATKAICCFFSDISRHPRHTE